MKQRISVDIETYSELDLTEVGVNKYASHPSTEILILCYAVEDGPVHTVVPAEGEEIPPFLFNNDNSLVYSAFNAMFENTLISAKVKNMDIAQWECTMALANLHGLPGSLDTLGEAIGLAEDDKKLKEGKKLIDMFSKPCKPSKRTGMLPRRYPVTDPAAWQRFKEYCAQDVIAERAIRNKMEKMGLTMSAFERRLWVLDCRMNADGLLADEELAKKGNSLYEEFKQRTKAEMLEITGVENPNSIAQIKNWMADQGVQVGSLDKEAVSELMSQDIPDNVMKVLDCRRKMGKTSAAKFDKILRMLVDSEEGRKVCDGLQYCGAQRTGRWAGRGVQLHNLPKSHMSVGDMQIARDLLRGGTFEDVVSRYTDPLHMLTELIRTVFIPSAGKRFAVADFSAIEARVIAWLTGEKWRLDVFRTHGKIYEASASAMFHVPIDTIAKGQPNEDMRPKGKVAELALGYQGGVGALERMGAYDMGLQAHELPGIVSSWREANPAIVRAWREIEDCAVETIRTGYMTMFRGKLHFTMHPDTNTLIITLPSGRSLYYWDARLTQGSYNRPGIVSKTVAEKSRKWVDRDTYGGKLVENITQAIARDCLAEALIRVSERYRVKFHVHDEIIAEVSDDDSLEDIVDLMCVKPGWAPDLPLNADGFICDYYRKD